MARPPLSLKKITYEPFKGRVLFHTTYSDYFKENLHMFDTLDFLAELTQHIPPKGVVCLFPVAFKRSCAHV